MERKVENVIMNTKRKFVADGVFRAEVNGLLTKALVEFGYSGSEINFSANSTEIRVLLSKYNDIMNQEKLHKIKELESIIKQRFGFNKRKNHKLTLKAKMTDHKGVCAQEQCELLKLKMVAGVPVRTAALSIIRLLLKRGAKGCEVIVSGKLRQQRAKATSFKDGFMIHTGEPRELYIDAATTSLELKQGMLGIKVRIMLPYNEGKEGQFGVSKQLPDIINFYENK